MILDSKSRRDAQQARKLAKERFKRARKVERSFARKLKAVAAHVGDLVTGMTQAGRVDVAVITGALNRYADLLGPWARSVAGKMQAEVAARDEQAWATQARTIGVELRKEIQKAPIAEAMRPYLDEQVELITSLPRQAALRVQKLAIEAVTESGARAEQLVEQIRQTGKVTESRAMLIARTEVSRTSTMLTAARAQYVGSEGYIWRSSEDGDVRPLHKKLNGKFFRWDDPPVSGESGERSHPGAIYNCRCWPEPVIPD